MYTEGEQMLVDKLDRGEPLRDVPHSFLIETAIKYKRDVRLEPRIFGDSALIVRADGTYARRLVVDGREEWAEGQWTDLVRDGVVAPRAWLA